MTGERVFLPGGARRPTEVLNDFIDKRRVTHGVEPICKAPRLAPSGGLASCSTAERTGQTMCPGSSPRDPGAAHPNCLPSRHADARRRQALEAACERTVVASCNGGATDAASVRCHARHGGEGPPSSRTRRLARWTASRPCRAERPNKPWVGAFPQVSTWQGGCTWPLSPTCFPSHSGSQRRRPTSSEQPPPAVVIQKIGLPHP